ncbi:MAG: hypothetical protein Kow00104_15470 [Rhodothalassiaceae bacterium]
MNRLMPLLAIFVLLTLGGCGRRGEILPPDGKVEDPRITSFRAEEAQRIEQERAQYRITGRIGQRADDGDGKQAPAVEPTAAGADGCEIAGSDCTDEGTPPDAQGGTER